MRGAIVLSAGALGFPLGCSFFVDTKGLSAAPGTETGPETSTTQPDDGAIDTSASGDRLVDGEDVGAVDAGTADATSLPPTGSFESLQPKCGSEWLSAAMLASSTVARTGSRSCRLCGTNPDAAVSVQFSMSFRPPSGVYGPGTYRFVFYARQDPQAAAPTNFAGYIEVAKADGGIATLTNAATLQAAWTAVDVQATVELNESVSSLVITSFGGAGYCILVDDVSLTRTP